MSQSKPDRPPPKEDDTNEFKAAEALKDPSIIAREVVAFLNSNGGHVWVGVREDPAGVTYERIPDPDKTRVALHNHLVDTIEPALRSEDFEIEETKDGLLLVRVASSHARGPFAQIVKRGRWFGLRVGDRVREMTYDEIAAAFVKGAQSKAAHGTLRSKTIERAKEEQQEQVRQGRPGLWMRILPTSPLGIDFDDGKVKDQFRDWLTTWHPGDVPRAWSHLILPRYGTLAFPEGERCTHSLGDLKSLTISSTGELTFELTETKLVRDHFGRGSELSPYAVMGFPTSILRLMAKILDEFGKGETDREMVVAMTIVGVANVKLYPGSPRDPFYGDEEGASILDAILARAPFTFAADEVVKEPDRCALRIVRWIYEGCFGLTPEDIPPEFDRDRATLNLPD